MKKYDASMIKVKNVPQLQILENNKCCRTYNYCFNHPLPEQSELDKIADGLQQRYILSQERYQIPEDIEVVGYVSIKRLTDYEARVIYLTNQPEETCIYISGIRKLPREIEKLLGTVKSIQGDARENWITDYKKYID
ncbi:MAG: hypothetical protein WBA39_18015 [Rivularia sp. (in: cyanobacteria)]